ncbi:hypothetical protein, conserved [Eimeria acervulina]|uniref:Transmembrane protein n=1 Tax=Eimeria acervulina TaxID=5801 RepID=U6GL04_EIMAC|nr:hypothetical protein, conserved [Eimeria acervulina]CDI80850.1 hypothetical protein, conserved [Eimeria acervulina]
MGFFIPALLLGGFGMSQHLATKELDDLMRESERPLFGFWWGVGLGAVFGFWLGINCSGLFERFSSISKAGRALFNFPADDTQQQQQQQQRH